MKTLIRNLVVIGVSSLFQAVGVFAKGVILARILGVHEFGLAVIVIAVTGSLDMFADAGIDRFIVQSRFGYREDVVRTSHSFRVGGSTVVGISIAILAYPLSLLFRAPELALPIAATGGVVILRGFVNLAYKLQQREHRFELETVIDTLRVTADLLVTTAIAIFTHSFAAVIAGSYANALVQLAISHLFTEARYSFKPRTRLLGLVSAFSVPIYINATMLFAAMQGDRFVVAGMFTKREVALYAVACTLGQGVTTLIGKVAERILLPILAPKGRPETVRRLQVSTIGAIFIFGALLFEVGTSALAPPLTTMIYGRAYSGLNNIIYAAAIFQMTQIEQSWLNSVLIANGSTKFFPRITLMRSIAFPAAIIFAYMGFSLISIPIAFCLGAALSLGMSYYCAWPLYLIDWRLPLTSFLFIIASLGIVIMHAFL